jgi:hypothetical protein
MSRLSRMSALVILVLLVALTPALTAFAQTGGDPICNGLTAADCAVLTGAGDAMDGVDSLSIPSWSLALALMIQGEGIDLQTSGSAPALDFAEPPTVHFIIENAVLTTPDGTESGGLEFITQDNMLFVKVDDEWYGGSADDQDLDDVGEMPDLGDLEALGELDLNVDLSGAISTVRGADVEMMGQSMAVFTTSLDPGKALTALLMDPAIGGALGMALGEADLGMDELRPEDLQLVGALLGPMLSKSSISFEQWVGLDDSLIHKIVLNVVIDVDLSFIAPELGVVTGNLVLESEMVDFNAAFEVTVPETYKSLDDLNLEELEGLELGM